MTKGRIHKRSWPGTGVCLGLVSVDGPEALANRGRPECSLPDCSDLCLLESEDIENSLDPKEPRC